MKYRRKTDSRFPKKPPEIQTTANFDGNEVNLFREAFSNKAASKASASFGKGASLHLDSGLDKEHNALNLKRRETIGGKMKTPQKVNTGAYESPNKNRIINHKTEVEIPVEVKPQSNSSWTKNKSRYSKPMSQDLLNSYGPAGLSASKLIHDLLRSRQKHHQKSNSKFVAASKSSIQELSMLEKNHANSSSRVHEETVRIEEDSDKKTEKKSSPINRTNIDLLNDSPRINSQNIVLKEMSHRSEFTSQSQSILADSSRNDN